MQTADLTVMEGGRMQRKKLPVRNPHTGRLNACFSFP